MDTNKLLIYNSRSVHKSTIFAGKTVEWIEACQVGFGTIVMMVWRNYRYTAVYWWFPRSTEKSAPHMWFTHTCIMKKERGITQRGPPKRHKTSSQIGTHDWVLLIVKRDYDWTLVFMNSPAEMIEHLCSFIKATLERRNSWLGVITNQTQIW